jgi:glycosyltransferase involved in cell wall biosynthesis
MSSRSILLIWWSLGIGGIETFFLRLVEERARKNLKTKILLFSSKKFSNQNIIKQISKHCEVFFLDRIFTFPEISKVIALLSPLKKSEIKILLKDVEQIHVACGYHALFANRIVRFSKIKPAITVGFYHSLEFLWGGERIPYYEKVNRHFVLEFLPKKNLLLFSAELLQLYQKAGFHLRGAQTFRIGVIHGINVNQHKVYTKDPILKIVSVGRLVEFKTYNIWMLDVVAELKKKTKVIYDIYGDGPIRAEIEKKIKDLDLSDSVKVRGLIEYKDFHKTIICYDIFVGSGTSIIEASSFGLCCIVGIESIRVPLSYDFFDKSYMFEYNILLKNKTLIPVQELIEEFLSKSIAEKTKMSEDHKKAADNFSIKKCAEDFQSLSQCSQNIYKLKFFGLLYTVSYLFSNSMVKIKNGHKYNKKYDAKV